MNKQGKIIIAEGIDKAGKTVQCKKLVEYLENKGETVFYFEFPEYHTEQGKRIGQLLKQVRDIYEEIELETLYYYERIKYRNAMLNYINKGYYVVCNRHYPSSLAYRNPLNKEFVKTLNSVFIEDPHFSNVFVLNITVEESFKRKPIRDDLYEADKEFLSQVRNNYLHLALNYKWKVVDASRDPDEIHQDIVNYLEENIIQVA